MTQTPLSFASGYAFGPFVIDTVRRTIREGDRPIPLHSKAFEVLVNLIADRERVVPKEELISRIWPDTFVQENNLARHVSTLRKALGESPDQSNWILTVPGRGYRFIAPVIELDADAPALRSHQPQPAAASVLTDPLTASGTDEGPVVPALAPEAQAPVVAVESFAPRTPPRRRRWMAAVVFASAVATVVIVIGAARRPVATQAARPWMLQQVTYGPATQLNPAWSPDGKSLVFASDRGGNYDLFLQSLDGAEPVRLTDSPADELEPAWSPDGGLVAYRSQEGKGGIFVKSPSGGDARRVGPLGFEPRWSPEGMRLLYLSSVSDRPNPRIFVVSRDGGTPTEFGAALSSKMRVASVAWHPDGKRISAVGLTNGNWAFMTVSTDTAGDPIVSDINPSIRSVMGDYGLRPGRFVWNSTGTRIYFEGRSQDGSSIWTVRVDPKSLAWTGDLERLTSGLGLDQHLSLADSGHRIAFESASERTRIWAYPLSAQSGTIASAGHPITPGAAGEFDAAVSRDGQRLVYRTERGHQQELWQLSLADGDLRRLVADPLRVRSAPRWSPDGSALTYLVSPRDSSYDQAGSDVSLAVMPLSGGSERLVRTSFSGGVTPDDWSADGQFVLGACRPHPNDHSAVCLVPVSGSGPTKVLVADPEHELRNGRFSPDQQWITFTRVARGVTTVCVQRASGGPIVELTEGTTFEDKAHWSPDGRIVYFISNRGGLLNVWGRRFDEKAGAGVGGVFQVTDFESPRHQLPSRLQSIDLAVVKGQLFVPITETTGQIWMIKEMAP